ncbi:MAG TPA: hypothetical protein VKR58_05385 [Aquella sp.]|nr:hypothetical protein [Aquella sp.]
MSELFSGIIGACLVAVIGMVWDVFKQKNQKRGYNNEIRNELYLELMVLLQYPVERFQRGSEKQVAWWIEMEKLGMKLAILGDNQFIENYLKILEGARSAIDIESLRFQEVNNLRNYFGNHILNREKYNKLLGIKPNKTE